MTRSRRPSPHRSSSATSGSSNRSLGDYYGVSRTVVRDVLSRLHERGLIAKTASSHWVASALTAQSVRERFELRGSDGARGASAAPPTARNTTRSRRRCVGSASAIPLSGRSELGRSRPALMTHCLVRGPNEHLDRADPAESPAPRRRFARADQSSGLPRRRQSRQANISCSSSSSPDRAIEAAAIYWRSHLASARGEESCAVEDRRGDSGPAGRRLPYLTRREV